MLGDAGGMLGGCWGDADPVIILSELNKSRLQLKRSFSRWRQGTTRAINLLSPTETISRTFTPPSSSSSSSSSSSLCSFSFLLLLLLPPPPGPPAPHLPSSGGGDPSFLFNHPRATPTRWWVVAGVTHMAAIWVTNNWRMKQLTDESHAIKKC